LLTRTSGASDELAWASLTLLGTPDGGPCLQPSEHAGEAYISCVQQLHSRAAREQLWTDGRRRLSWFLPATKAI